LTYSREEEKTVAARVFLLLPEKPCSLNRLKLKEEKTAILGENRFFSSSLKEEDSVCVQGCCLLLFLKKSYFG
jgi:hypothetical protein